MSSSGQKSKASGLFGIASGKAADPEASGPVRYVPGGVIASKYRLVRLLGEGGMGAVWLARNMALEVDVAIKLIRLEMSTKETAERLLQEARSAARIDHPAIVRVYDFGETDHKDPYIVMEYLEGESLREVLDRKGRIFPANAVQMLLPIASGLSVAHAKGVIHRDLKPDNVILVKDERGLMQPKVVDFGVAKLERKGEKRKVTQAGAIVGSVDYMSPEQAKGIEQVDERTDVWSLTVLLYELITGVTPFQGPNYNALLFAIMQGDVVPTTEIGVGDEELWAVLEKGLAKEPEARWPSMRALGTALAGWCIGQSVETDITGAVLALEWLEGLPKRPLSEPPASLEAARAVGLSMRASITSLDDLARASGLPARPSVSGIAVEVDLEPDEEEAPLPPSAPVPSSAKPPPLKSRTPPPRPPARPRSRWPWIAGAIGLTAAGVFLTRALTSSRVDSPESPAPVPARPDLERGANAKAPPKVPSATTQAPSAEPAASASAVASAAPSEAPVASAAPAAAAPESVDSCALARFAGDTFTGKAISFEPVCQESDPRRGAAWLKAQVVRSGQGRVSEGMREWAMLSWYEMAAFAAIRGDCCPSAPPMKLPAPVGRCEAVDATLNDLASSRDEKEADAIVARFRGAFTCAIASGVAADYTYSARMRGGEETALRKTLARRNPGPSSRE